jgi:hypothetical protein
MEGETVQSRERAHDRFRAQKKKTKARRRESTIRICSSIRARISTLA